MGQASMRKWMRRARPTIPAVIHVPDWPDGRDQALANATLVAALHLRRTHRDIRKTEIWLAAARRMEATPCPRPRSGNGGRPWIDQFGRVESLGWVGTLA